MCVNDQRPKKFLVIQALRFVAASLVVFTHSTFYASERLDKQFSVWNRGTRGVDMFFVISGFVMVYSSQKLFGSAGGWRIFAEHRIIRIVPLYYLVTSLKLLIMLLTAGLSLHAVLSPTTAICSYLYLPSRNGDGKLWPIVAVGWTLNFEMMFYALFTAAMFLHRNVIKFVGVILAALSIGAFFRQPSWPPASFYLDSIVLEFFLGMLIARWCLNGVYIPKRFSLALLGLGLLLLLLPPTDWNLPKILVSGLPAALIVWSAASIRNLDNAIPGFILYLGNASYSIYLIHPFVSPLPPVCLNRLRIDLPSLAVVLSVALGLIAGCFLHQFIELPMTNRLKSYLEALRKLHSMEAV